MQVVVNVSVSFVSININRTKNGLMSVFGCKGVFFSVYARNDNILISVCAYKCSYPYLCVWIN